MENVWVLAALWLGIALVATLLAIWLKISTALSEIDAGGLGRVTRRLGHGAGETD